MKQRTYCPICGATIRKLSRQECFKKVAEVFQNAAASCAGLDHRRCPICGADLGQWSIHHCLIRVVQIVRDPSAAFERPPEPTKGEIQRQREIRRRQWRQERDAEWLRRQSEAGALARSAKQSEKE